MLMSDEDMAQTGQRDISQCELTSHAIATINDVRGTARNDDLCRRGARLSRSRPPTSTEKHEARLPALRSDRSGHDRGCRSCRTNEEVPSTNTGSHDAPDGSTLENADRAARRWPARDRVSGAKP